MLELRTKGRILGAVHVAFVPFFFVVTRYTISPIFVALGLPPSVGAFPRLKKLALLFYLIVSPQFPFPELLLAFVFMEPLFLTLSRLSLPLCVCTLCKNMGVVEQERVNERICFSVFFFLLYSTKRRGVSVTSC